MVVWTIGSTQFEEEIAEYGQAIRLDPEHGVCDDGEDRFRQHVYGRAFALTELSGSNLLRRN